MIYDAKFLKREFELFESSNSKQKEIRFKISHRWLFYFIPSVAVAPHMSQVSVFSQSISMVKV